MKDELETAATKRVRGSWRRGENDHPQITQITGFLLETV